MSCYVVTHTDLKVKTDVWSKSEEDQVIVRGKPVMEVNGLVEGAPVDWKIDTGAVTCNTFITEEVYYSILPLDTPVLEQVRKKFKTADGRELNTIGTAKMILTFEDINIYFLVFVGGVQCNLHRQDFMTKFQGQWNYDNNSLSLNFGNINLSEETEQGCLIVSVGNSVIPPRHESVLKSKLVSKTNIKEGILVPMNSLCIVMDLQWPMH